MRGFVITALVLMVSVIAVTSGELTTVDLSEDHLVFESAGYQLEVPDIAVDTFTISSYGNGIVDGIMCTAIDGTAVLHAVVDQSGGSGKVGHIVPAYRRDCDRVAWQHNRLSTGRSPIMAFTG